MKKEFKVHKHHENLTGEHVWGDAGQLVLLILFLGAWIVDTYFLKYSVFLNEMVSLYIRIPLAIIILSMAFVLARRGMKTVFGSPEQEAKVFSSGVFAIVRHPIYLGAILLYLGILLFSVSLIATGVWMLTIIFYYFISRYEEKVLTDRFGKEYEDYKKRVPMLFPVRF